MKKIVNVIVLLIMILLISSCVVEEPEYQTIFLYDEYHANLAAYPIDETSYHSSNGKVIDVVLKINNHETNEIEITFCFENGEEIKSTSYKWEYIGRSINEDSGLYVTLQNCENEFVFSFVNIYNCVKVKGRQNTIDENISFIYAGIGPHELINLSAIKQEKPSYLGEYELVFETDEYHLSYLTYQEEINKAIYNGHIINDIIFKVIDKDLLQFELSVIDINNEVINLPIKRVRIADPIKETGILELTIESDDGDTIISIACCLKFPSELNIRDDTNLGCIILSERKNQELNIFNIKNQMLFLGAENQITEQIAPLVKDIEVGTYHSLQVDDSVKETFNLDDFELTISHLEGSNYNVKISAKNITNQEETVIIEDKRYLLNYSPDTVEQLVLLGDKIYVPSNFTDELRRFSLIERYKVEVDGEITTKTRTFIIEVLRTNSEVLNINENILYRLIWHEYPNEYYVYFGE